MDSVLEEDLTLPLGYSFNPDMYLPSTSEDVNYQSLDHPPTNEQPSSRKSDSTTSSLGPGTHYISGRMSPGNNRNMKDFATQISELKKENFSLKLRIFYMEERMTEQFSGDHDQLWKTNIELKVECDSLRKELGDKHDLLVKASNAVACMEAGNPEELRKAKVEAENEIKQLRELMDEKVANAEKERQLAHQDSEQALEQALTLKKELVNVQQQNKELGDALNEANEALEKAKQEQFETDTKQRPNSAGQNEELVALQRNMEELRRELKEKNRTIVQLQESLTTKQTLIEVLNDEKATLENEKVQSLVEEVKELKDQLNAAESALNNTLKTDDTSQERYQDLITEQQQRLDEFELATRQMSEELDKREIEIKDLTKALNDAKESVKDLNAKVEESHAAQEKHDKALKDINKRDRAITALTMTVRKKDHEIAELTREMDELNLQVDTLRFDIKDKDAQVLKLLAELKKAETSQIETSPSKDSLIKQLRDQLKESDAALQAMQEEKTTSPILQEKSTQSDRCSLQPNNQSESDIQVNPTAVNETLLLELRHQLLVAESALQTQQHKAQQFQEQLREADNALQDALDERSRLEDERDKCTRDLNQRIREQTRQIERLKSQVASYEETIATIEDDSKEKDWQLEDLNTKYKKLMKEIKDLMDRKTRMEDDHEKYVRDANQQAREDNRHIERLKSQVSDYEETVASLDSKIKEKDWQLQELATKHKNLLKDLQQKEEERVRAVLERDELLSQCEEEKSRFSTLAGKMLRRTGSDASTGSSLIELEALSRVRELEDELFKKNQALIEATRARDRAERDHAASKFELDDALASHSREINENHRELGLKDVEIRQLKDMLRETEDKMHECENKMRGEVNKLIRQNSDLREKLRMSEEEITNLKPKKSNQDQGGKANSNQDLIEEMQELRRELNQKDDDLKKMRQDLLQRNVADENCSQGGHNTFNNNKRRPRSKKHANGFRDSFSSSSFGDESDNDVTTSDVTGDDQTTPRFNRLRQVHAKNRKGNLTMDTTFGLPLDDTSYMSIANGTHQNSEAAANINGLKQLLSDTRSQLSNAFKEIADLKHTATEHISKIEVLESLVEEKTVENNTLMEEYNKVNQQRIAKELELRGITTQFRNVNANIKQHFVDADAMRNDSATESDSAAITSRSRRKSGEESDGMSSLSRRELCETISNLKKKLSNAEKVNDLLTQRMNDVNRADSHSVDNTQLVADLTEEVKRLKSQLETQANKESDRESPSKTSLRLIPSKLPLPKNSKIQMKAANLRPELERARMLNKKLNDQLAATEQTVRIQAEKLNKCRAAMRDAGISSPPVSPLRTTRSVPDLHLPPEDYHVEKIKENRSQGQIRSFNVDTNDVSTQTTDSGISSLTPNSEQKFNSLIQAQAKELSLLREQLKKSRDTCRRLQTEMDVLSRYLSALSSGENRPDSSLMAGVEQEIERSKKLVGKLRQSLKENADDIVESDADSDSSAVSSPLPPPVYEIHQLERLKNEMKDKDDEIIILKEKINNLEITVTSQSKKMNRLSVDPMHFAEKWSSVPNLHPQYNNSQATQAHIPTSFFKKKPSSVGSPYQSMNEHGLLTPGSSHLSLHSASEDEMKRLSDDILQFPTRYGENDDRYASLPDVLDKPQRSSWPNGHGHVMNTSQTKRRSMPMYQRTIAVTEYLPPNTRSDKGECYSAASEQDESSRRLLPSSDASRCSASYGGQWAKPNMTAPKSENVRFTSRNKSSPLESTRLDVGDSSCDEVQGDRNYKLAREVDRLRRRLTDSKRINRSLKEELDFANKSLIRTKDSLVPGYHRSPQHDAELLAEHLSGIRGLRQRLEHSIATNDRLREKLENRLKDSSHGSKEHLSANIYVASQNHATPDSSRVRSLEKKLEKLETENEKLKKRLQAEEKAHSTYQEAVNEMKALQQHLIEKSEKIDQLTEHVARLQYELKQQNALSDGFGAKLRLQDADLSEYKQKLEQVQNEKNKLVQDNLKAHETNKQMWAEVQNSRSQLDESRQLIDSLKSELALYEKLQVQQNQNASLFSTPVQLDLQELLGEIRSLRIELEKSINANAALRTQLEEQLRSPHGGDDSALTTINIHHMSPRSSSSRDNPSNRRSPLSARRKLKLETSVQSENVLMTPPASASSGGEEHNFNFDPLEMNQSKMKNGDTPIKSLANDASMIRSDPISKEKPFYSRGGPYTLCKIGDFIKLQQTMAKSGLVARTADSKVVEIIGKMRRSSNSETKIFKELSKSTSSLCHLLDEGDELLRMFWPALIPYPSTSSTVDTQGRTCSSTGLFGDPGRSCTSSALATGNVTSSISVPTIKRQSSDTGSSVTSETDGLRREVGRLRRRLSTQDRLLQTTVDRLHNTNRLKEGIENAIVKQLSKTHDVLKKARGNLQQVQDSEMRSYVP